MFVKNIYKYSIVIINSRASLSAIFYMLLYVTLYFNEAYNDKADKHALRVRIKMQFTQLFTINNNYTTHTQTKIHVIHLALTDTQTRRIENTILTSGYFQFVFLALSLCLSIFPLTFLSVFLSLLFSIFLCILFSRRLYLQK